jgi:hypothetical protein
MLDAEFKLKPDKHLKKRQESGARLDKPEKMEYNIKLHHHRIMHPSEICLYHSTIKRKRQENLCAGHDEKGRTRIGGLLNKGLE